MKDGKVGQIIAGTGHRPEDAESEAIVRRKVHTAFLYDVHPHSTFICGGAAGFDLWAADEVLKLGFDVWLVQPWRGHVPRVGDEDLFARVAASAVKRVFVVDSEEFPGNYCYHKRNEWMVDHATHVLAYWNPEKESGGTYACYRYARKVGVPIRNLWDAAPF